MNKKRVLQLGKNFNYGGTETVILNLCNGFYDDKNIDIILCTSGGELEAKLNNKNIKHIKINDISEKSFSNFLSIFKTIRKVVKNEKIDIIHSHHRLLTIIANFVTLGMRTKVIHTAHYMSKENRLGFLLGKNIIAVGENVKWNLIEKSKVNKEKISVIYNGIDLIKFKKNNIINYKDSNKINILSINRLSYEKGVDVLLYSIAIVVKEIKNIKVTIIGDGKERDKLKKIAEELNICDYIEFIGFKNNVLEYINQCDFVVSTSRTEGLPITPLEVFSQSKAIVATNVGGVKEVIEDGVNGVLVTNENYTEIADAIILLIKNNNLREKLGKNGYKTVHEKFSKEVMVNKYKEYYINIMREDANGK